MGSASKRTSFVDSHRDLRKTILASSPIHRREIQGHSYSSRRPTTGNRIYYSRDLSRTRRDLVRIIVIKVPYFSTNHLASFGRNRERNNQEAQASDPNLPPPSAWNKISNKLTQIDPKTFRLTRRSVDVGAFDGSSCNLSCPLDRKT